MTGSQQLSIEERIAQLNERGAILCFPPGQPVTHADLDAVEQFMDFLAGMRAPEGDGHDAR